MQELEPTFIELKDIYPCLKKYVKYNRDEKVEYYLSKDKSRTLVISHLNFRNGETNYGCFIINTVKGDLLSATKLCLGTRKVMTCQECYSVNNMFFNFFLTDGVYRGNIVGICEGREMKWSGQPWDWGIINDVSVSIRIAYLKARLIKLIS